MGTLLWIILATIIVSLIAFVGIIVLALRKKSLESIILILVALSAGALIGGAFLHLIPEALEFGDPNIFLYVIGGFVLFFIIEKVLHWRHCHKKDCKIHTFAYMNLFGEGIHNFIDGLIIAASFVVSIPLGIATTLAVIMHEIPQEIGDFGVLVYGGFRRKKALMLNFLIALTAIGGGLIGYVLSSTIGGIMPVLLAIAAGGFIYIAASDLIPELREEVKIGRPLLIILVFLIGISIMFALRFVG